MSPPDACVPGRVGPPPIENIDRGRCCVIVTGPPAAGKTTITRGLAGRLERSALLNGDQIHWLVVGGRVWALGEPRDEAARQVRLGNQNLVSLARNCAEAGFTPVIDWILPDREQFDFFADQLAPLPVWVIVLAPRAEVCRERNLHRDEVFAFDGYDELVGAMWDAFGDRVWWLDTTGQSADETLAEILRVAGLPS